jgi:hypothetical protein
MTAKYMMKCSVRLGVTYDSNATSNMLSVANAVGKNLRNTYTTHNFLSGCSTQVFNDWGYASTGIPADQVSLEVVAGTPTDVQFQEATAVANASLYVFLLHDSTFQLTFQLVCVCFVSKSKWLKIQSYQICYKIQAD